MNNGVRHKNPIFSDLQNSQNCTTVECAQNRILRRADWRYLLPDPRPRRTLCLSDELKCAAQIISEQVVMHAGAASCDLAVATEPNSAAIQQIARALTDAGTLYAEWYEPTCGGMRHVRRTLRQHGFGDVNFYWAYPEPRRASAAFWLPLDAPEALDYFLRTRPPHANPVRQQIRGLLHKSWLLAQRAGLVLPLYCVARKRGARQTEAPLEALCQSAQSGEPRAATRKFSRVLLTGGERSINKAVLLAFETNARQPYVAVKFARVLEANVSLVHERDVLDALAALPLCGVPRIVDSIERDGDIILAESVVTGAPLYTKLNRATYPALAHQATDWLIQLADSPRPAPRADWHARMLELTLNAFTQNYGAAAGAGWIEKTRASLGKLDIPGLVPEQRDFSPWNVMVQADGKLAVLDWESAELCGIPTLDLIYFQTYLAFFLDGAMQTKRFVESYRALLDPTTFTGEIFAACMTRYANAVGLDIQHLPTLRALTWLIHSRSEYERLEADRQPGKLEHAVFLNLWRVEMQERGGFA